MSVIFNHFRISVLQIENLPHRRVADDLIADRTNELIVTTHQRGDNAEDAPFVTLQHGQDGRHLMVNRGRQLDNTRVGDSLQAKDMKINGLNSCSLKLIVCEKILLQIYVIKTGNQKFGSNKTMRHNKKSNERVDIMTQSQHAK